MKRNVSYYIVQLMMEWYENQQMIVRWGNEFSNKFSTTCGVRQGSLLSLYLFNILYGWPFGELQRMKVGCFVNNMILNHLFYAGDIAVFASSVNGLQQLVYVCHHFITEGHYHKM